MLLFAITLNTAVTKTIEPHFKTLQFWFFYVAWMKNEKASQMLRYEFERTHPRVMIRDPDAPFKNQQD